MGETAVLAHQAFHLALARSVLEFAVLALVIVFVMRPIMNWLAAFEPSPRARPAAAGAGGGGPSLPAAVPAPPSPSRAPAEREAQAGRPAYDEVYAFVERHPERAADVLRRWSREGPPGRGR